jgi:tRNA(Ile)-lysidine synthase
MADLVDRVAATGLLGGPVVVLVSGGRDSVCLLDCAVRLTPAVVALHVDHGLRPGSAGDAAACADLCAALGVELVVERPSRPAGPGNLHAWARGARRAAAADLAAARTARIATGHTATDQAETVLYRLAAAPGRRALLGMRPDDGAVVRPLLAVTREETAAHCAARGLPWREDPSNDDQRFARARVRSGLLPALRAVHPAAEANVVRTAELLRDEAEVLDAAVAGVLDGAGAIALPRLAALPRALARLVLRRLAEDATGALCPRGRVAPRDVLALGPDAALDLGTAPGPSSRAGSCARRARAAPDAPGRRRDAWPGYAARPARTGRRRPGGHPLLHRSVAALLLAASSPSCPRARRSPTRPTARPGQGGFARVQLWNEARCGAGR